MSDSDFLDMKRRLRELLSVPERDRREEEWDEINELEIRLAPGNRADFVGKERSQERRGRRGERNRGYKPEAAPPAPSEDGAAAASPNAAHSGDPSRPRGVRRHRRRRNAPAPVLAP